MTIFTKGLQALFLEAVGSGSEKEAEVTAEAAEVQRVPGLDCPICHFRITMTIPMLLSGDPVYCPRCSLELRVDQEESSGVLKEVSKLQGVITHAEEIAKRGVQN